jgi:ABC-type transport system involved in multi-copper enzyme maturation permease subunit
VIRLLRGEVLKLRTIWSTWMILIITMVLTGGLGVVVGLAPHRHAVEALLYPARGTSRWFDLVLSTMTVSVDLALVLGIICITGEYRHKTVTSMLLCEPKRGKMVLAKLLSSAGGGVVVGVAGGVTGLVLGIGLVAGGFGDSGRMLTEYRHVFPGVLAACVLYGIYGLGLGALLKNQVVALVVGLGVIAVVEPILDGVVPAVGRWLPGQAAEALESVAASASSRGGGGIFSNTTHLITWWEGALVLLAYGVVLAVAGTLTTLRADVT